MGSVGTRELSYFVAVAEELHFGRAAQRLGIAQPPLSRAIKLLERRVGVPLLERGSRGVALTAAGEVLLREGREALAAVAAAVRRAQRAARPEARLVLVVKPGGDGGLLHDILDAYEAHPQATGLDVVVCGAGEQAALLRDGRADAALLRTPHNDLSGFDSQELLVESQVVVLPQRHRLATRPSIRLTDLRGEAMPRWPGLLVDGPAAPAVHDVGQMMQLIALARMVAVLPASIRGHLRDDLVCVPVLDAPATTMVIAWPERRGSRPLAALIAAAVAAAAAHGGGDVAFLGPAGAGR